MNIQEGVPKTRANKFERIKINLNIQALNYYGIIDLFDRFKAQMLSLYGDVRIGHEEDWSGISLGWDFQTHNGNEGPYTVGKGIFATVKKEDVFISYSGMEGEAYLVSRSNISDLMYDGIEKARLPTS